MCLCNSHLCMGSLPLLHNKCKYCASSTVVVKSRLLLHTTGLVWGAEFAGSSSRSVENRRFHQVLHLSFRYGKQRLSGRQFVFHQDCSDAERQSLTHRLATRNVPKLCCLAKWLSHVSRKAVIFEG